MAEFVECSSISINYDATGKASVSLLVVKDNGLALQEDYTSFNAGGVVFTLALTNVTQRLIPGGWSEWSLQLEGVGN